MDPETARWFLSTIAEVTATLVGLVIVAMTFIIAEMRKILSDCKSIEDYVDTYGEVTGSPSKFVLIEVGMTMTVVISGLVTVLSAVHGLGEIGASVTDVTQATINNVELTFIAMLLVLLMYALTIVLVGYKGIAHEADKFEKALGGRKMIEDMIRSKAESKKEARKTERVGFRIFRRRSGPKATVSKTKNELTTSEEKKE